MDNPDRFPLTLWWSCCCVCNSAIKVKGVWILLTCDFWTKPWSKISHVSSNGRVSVATTCFYTQCVCMRVCGCVRVWRRGFRDVCVRPCRNTENPSPQIFRKRKIDASAFCVCLKFVTPREKASVCSQMILFQNPCQQFSSLFPACGFSCLDHLSRGTQATLCRPAGPVHSESPFTGYLDTSARPYNR